MITPQMFLTSDSHRLLEAASNWDMYCSRVVYLAVASCVRSMNTGEEGSSEAAMSA